MSDFTDKIIKVQKNNHDTLYCNRSAETRIMEDVGLDHASMDRLNRLLGLTIIINEGFRRPIVCERGDVFTTSSEYKYDGEEPNDI